MNLMGELNYFLGLQIKQNRKGIFINQAKYTKDLLKRFDNSKPMGTPMSPSGKIENDEKGKDVVHTRYRGMFGYFLCLTVSRPVIMFSVCMCTRFQSCPKEFHLLAVKMIFCYLVGTQDLGLFYPKSVEFNLQGYSDADYAQNGDVT